MNKHVESIACDNQFAHLENKGHSYLIHPASFSCSDRQSQSKGTKLTTGLIIFSLFLLFLFF